VVIALLIAACVSFLYVQFGPSCYEYTGRAQREEHCKCMGYEFMRSDAAKVDGTSSSVCFGLTQGRSTNFSYWDRKGISRAERLTIRMGDKTVRDTTERKEIKYAGELFDSLGTGWRPSPGNLPLPEYVISFGNYTLAKDGLSTTKQEVWFGLGDSYITTEGKLYRPLSDDEKRRVMEIIIP
jgi:hypothetical protein